MKGFFDGIGQWAATFACGGKAAEGQVAKVSGNGQVSACSAGDDFCGVVLAVAGGGAACSVALGGMATVKYTGTAPDLGWSVLTADGTGGVKSAESGRSFLVADVDSAAGMVTIVL